MGGHLPVETRADSRFHYLSIDRLVRKHKLPEPVLVTRPTMPDLKRYCNKLREIWESRWLTNAGRFHKEFERELADYLGVEYLSLFCNGTAALMVALQALDINGGEVITTPFTFPATPHVLHWNRIRPVFCDIDEKTFNLNPNLIDNLVNPATKAILGVHVFGTPCDVEAVQAIADRHGLHVIYDAAHAFGVNYKGRSVLKYGDFSVLSFHATKLFTTGEGGALICQSEDQKERIDFLKNFGIADEETVIGPGINGKMNEFQAAFGLLELEVVNDEIANRGRIAGIYRDRLRCVPGLRMPHVPPDVIPNYSYFPVIIDEERYGLGRDEVYLLLRKFNIYARKYFFPLCSHFSCYASLPSAASGNLPVAERIARRVLCLPIYGSMEYKTAKTICAVLKDLHRLAIENK